MTFMIIIYISLAKNIVLHKHLHSDYLYYCSLFSPTQRLFKFIVLYIHLHSDYLYVLFFIFTFIAITCISCLTLQANNYQ